MRTALVLMVVLGTTTPTWAAQRLVVLPSQWLEGAKADISPRLVDDAILAAAQAVGTAAVLGVSDLEAVVGLERQRDLLGCSEVACYVEIAGALGADQVLSVQLGRAGTAWVVSLKKLQVRSGNPSVEARLVETVSSVLPHSPAARAGILPGDELAMVEGKSVTAADDVLCRLASVPAGKVVTLSIMRDQDLERLRVKVGPATWPTRIGLMIEKATPEQRAARDIEGAGVSVVWVDDDGIAAYAGIEPGDILLSIERQGLIDPSVLVEAVRSVRAAGKESISVELARQRARLSVTLTLH